MKKLKLAYYNAPYGNIGDDINVAIWENYFCEYIDEASDTAFIGIGSILDSRFQNEKRKIVFGAGARSSASVPDVGDGSWDIRFVRGPNTVSALRPQEIKCLSDPAILAPYVFNKNTGRRNRVIGFVPYFKTDVNYARRIAEIAGFKLISPTQDPESFIEDLVGCGFVFAEAMHGAILADAYRIPWRPIRISNMFHEKETHMFKWGDWMGSVGVKAEFISLPNVYGGDAFFSKVKDFFKPYYSACKLMLVSKRRSKWSQSNDEIISSRQKQMLEEIVRLKKDLNETN